MIIAKNDEEKRSKVWRIVTATATIVIIVVAAYFLFTLFAGNPLEGSWASEGSDLILTINKDSSAVVSWSEFSTASDIELNVRYAIDKTDKTITFRVEEAELEKVSEASDQEIMVRALQDQVGVLETTFDYNLMGSRMILAEREYGEQMVFVKK